MLMSTTAFRCMKNKGDGIAWQFLQRYWRTSNETANLNLRSPTHSVVLFFGVVVVERAIVFRDSKG